MTAGTMEKVHRLRDPRVRASAGAVLSYLAYRAHYADGRCAWPSLDTIAQVCFIDRRTVSRALDQLVELGYVRVSPDQSWNERDPETGQFVRRSYRTTVYDVLVENFRDVEDESAERKRDEQAAMVDGPAAGGHGVGEESRHDNLPPLENGALEVGDDKLSSESCQNVPRITRDKQLPPTPTGYPPASGETPRGESSSATVVDTEAAPLPAALSDEAEICSALAGRRRALRLSVDGDGQPGARDVRAVKRLLDRLRAEGEPDPSGRVRRALDWAFAPGRAYWQRRLRSGRRLAAKWDELCDDMRLDAEADRTRRAGRAAVGCVAGHRGDCEHVRAVGEDPRVRSRWALWAARHAHDADVAELLDRDVPYDDVVAELCSMLQHDDEDARRRAGLRAVEAAEKRAEIARARAENGGWMFVGSRRRNGGAR